jgi:hypothetical protein
LSFEAPGLEGVEEDVEGEGVERDDEFEELGAYDGDDVMREDEELLEKREDWEEEGVGDDDAFGNGEFGLEREVWVGSIDKFGEAVCKDGVYG